MNKFYNFIEKIGKHNFILIVFIIIVLLITGIYQTFSLYTESAGISLIDGIKTFKFILGNDTENTVTIASDSSKNIALTVSNNDKIKLKYGIYYSSSDDLTDVELGYKWDTEYLPNGSIDSNDDYVVTIQIENNSDSNVTINFGIKYGLESGGDLQLEVGEHWLDKKWNYPLSEVEAGSYVRYIGNNGCSGMSCYGQNANYVSDSDMGYCATNEQKFFVNGWRVAYIKNNNVHLISAGSPECMCTNSDGTYSNSSCPVREDFTKDYIYHPQNLNNLSISYCNTGFVLNGICNNNAWNFNDNDYTYITGNSLQKCYNSSKNINCGYQNSIIDNGGLYWFNNTIIQSNSLYYNIQWFPYHVNVGYAFVGGGFTEEINGIRPVIKLDDSVVVTGGSGTYTDPYTIDNRESVKDLSGNMNNGALKNNPTWDKKMGQLLQMVLILMLIVDLLVMILVLMLLLP